MPLSDQDRADMLRDGLDPERRRQFSAADKLVPASPRTLADCFSFFDAAQELRPRPATKTVPHYREFKL